MKKKYKNDLSVTNKKIFSLSDTAVFSNFKFETKFKNFKLVKLNPQKSFKEIDKLQCHFGTFVEIDIKTLDNIRDYVTKKFQTLTYYGLNHNNIEKTILNNGLKVGNNSIFGLNDENLLPQIRKISSEYAVRKTNLNDVFLWLTNS